MAVLTRSNRGPSDVEIVTLTGRHTLSAAATSTETLNIPFDALVLGFSGTVQTAVTGAGTWDAGDGTDVDCLADGVAIAVNTDFTYANANAGGLNGTAYAARVAAGAAWNLVFTAIGGGGAFTGGVIDYCLTYIAPPRLTIPLA